MCEVCYNSGGVKNPGIVELMHPKQSPAPDEYVKSRLEHQAKYGLDTLCHECGHDRHMNDCKQPYGYLTGKVCGCKAPAQGEKK